MPACAVAGTSRLIRFTAFLRPCVGGTDIKFIDDAWAPGTTADIIADSNLDSNDPAQVVIAAGIPVSAGINTFRWTGWLAAYGKYFSPEGKRHRQVGLSLKPA